MAAAGKWQLFNSFKGFMADGTIDLDEASSFRCALVTSSYTAALTHDTWSDISTNEVANGNGYATHGAAMTCTWTESPAGTWTFDSDNPTWAATDSGITARYAVIVHDTDANGALAAGDKVVAYCLLDSTPADVTVTAGNPLVIQIAATGIFAVSGGTGA